MTIILSYANIILTITNKWGVKMSFYDLPSYINDGMCALEDKAYGEAVAIMEEIQSLAIAAEARIKHLADCIGVWAECIKENGLTGNEHETKYLDDDNKELQKIINILIEVNSFKMSLANDVGYQNYRQKAA